MRNIALAAGALLSLAAWGLGVWGTAQVFEAVADVGWVVWTSLTFALVGVVLMAMGDEL